MLKHFKLTVIFILAFCLGLSSFLLAGTTGKISGRVTDANNGNPLGGVNVVIEGTSMGAATDMEGDYFIINVPPGSYTVEARMIGYTTQARSGVAVNADRTITVDFAIQQTVLEGQEVTVVADREIVPMDVSASQVVATAEEILEIPLVQDIGEFLNLQVGIEDDMIRGGAMQDAAFMMDGLMVVDNRTNTPLMNVNLSAIQEMNIIKGGFNAEYGNVRSGLINVVTRDGDVNHYNGSVDFRFSPAHLKHDGPSLFDPMNFELRPFLDPAVCWVGTANGTWDEETAAPFEFNTFQGWNAISADLLGDNDPSNDRTPEECRDMFVWLHRSEAKAEWNVPGANDLLQKYGSSLGDYEAEYGRDSHEKPYGDKPDLNVDLSLSGPIPFISKYLGNLTFFVSHRTNWEAWGMPMKTDYYKEQNTQAKLTSRLSGSMKLTLEAMYGEQNTLTNSNSGGGEGNYLRSGTAALSQPGNSWYPDSKGPFDIYSVMFGIAFDHVLSPSTFYNVRISQLRIINACYGSFNSDPVTGFHVTDRALANGEVEFRNTDPIIQIGSTWMDESPYGMWEQTVKQMPGTGNYYGSHAFGARDMGVSNAFSVKFDLTSQVDKYNQVKAGFLFNYDDLYTHTEHIRFEATWEARQTIWSQYPYRLGAYVQDKIEFEGMIANVGIRLDYNNPNVDWFLQDDPYSQYYSWKYKSVLLSDAPRERAEGHVKISPRLGISHPISAEAKLYFNYGHFYSMPSSSSMYRLEWGRKSDPVAAVGNPYADLPKTVAYELGVEYNILNQILLHVAGYYRDITDQIGNVGYENYDGTVDYSTSENRNYADVRGFEVRADKRFGRWVTGWLQYNYMVTTSGFIGRTGYYEDPNRQRIEGLQNPNLERPVARPTAAMNLRLTTPSDFGPAVGSVYPVGDFSVNFLVNWRAGRTQTWDPLGTGLLVNNLKWKSDYTVDVRIQKRVRIGRMNFSIFADITNLLNSDLWSTGGFEGGTNDEDNYLKSLKLEMYGDPQYATQYAADNMLPGDDTPGDLKSDDKPYINDPNVYYRMYRNVRSILLGLTFNF